MLTMANSFHASALRRGDFASRRLTISFASVAA
jgi:hypothetical protein